MKIEDFSFFLTNVWGWWGAFRPCLCPNPAPSPAQREPPLSVPLIIRIYQSSDWLANHLTDALTDWLECTDWLIYRPNRLTDAEENFPPTRMRRRSRGISFRSMIAAAPAAAVVVAPATGPAVVVTVVMTERRKNIDWWLEMLIRDDNWDYS